MAELETRLVELGALWQAPPTPMLGEGIVARLAGHPRPARSRGVRRRLVASLVLATLGAGAVAAIAPAREAILDLFRVGGETIRPVQTLPPARPSSDASDLGGRLSLGEAQERSGFPVRRPRLEELGPPDEVYRRAPPEGGLISFVWRARPGLPRATATGAGLLMTQVTGTAIPGKALDPSTVQEQVDVDGSVGLWLTGGPHVLGYLDEHDVFRTETTRLAGNTLIWSRGDITYRLEGRISRARALEIAESVR